MTPSKNVIKYYNSVSYEFKICWRAGLLASDNGSILGLGLCVCGTYSAQRMVRFRSDLADSLAGVTQQVSLGLVAFVNKSCVCPETE